MRNHLYSPLWQEERTCFHGPNAVRELAYNVAGTASLRWLILLDTSSMAAARLPKPAWICTHLPATLRSTSDGLSTSALRLLAQAYIFSSSRSVTLALRKSLMGPGRCRYPPLWSPATIQKPLVSMHQPQLWYDRERIFSPGVQ